VGGASELIELDSRLPFDRFQHEQSRFRQQVDDPPTLPPIEPSSPEQPSQSIVQFPVEHRGLQATD
jgi:hypothetical protein